LKTVDGVRGLEDGLSRETLDEGLLDLVRRSASVDGVGELLDGLDGFLLVDGGGRECVDQRLDRVREKERTDLSELLREERDGLKVTNSLLSEPLLGLVDSSVGLLKTGLGEELLGSKDVVVSDVEVLEDVGEGVLRKHEVKKGKSQLKSSPPCNGRDGTKDEANLVRPDQLHSLLAKLPSPIQLPRVPHDLKAFTFEFEAQTEVGLVAIRGSDHERGRDPRESEAGHAESTGELVGGKVVAGWTGSDDLGERGVLAGFVVPVLEQKKRKER
jgi:hypothetical protein